MKGKENRDEVRGKGGIGGSTMDGGGGGGGGELETKDSTRWSLQ